MKEVDMSLQRIVGIVLVVGLGSTLYWFLQSPEPQMVNAEAVSAANTSSPVVEYRPQEVIERVVSTAHLWRPIQEQVKDTVVQIFSHVAIFDVLQPYRSPEQGTMSGSGFFINDNGDIITNAHVVDQAKAVWIQIPSLGKRIIDVDVIGVSPDRDLALLRVGAEGLEIIKKELGSVPFLPMGNSDILLRSDDVLALGYPLGQQSLKSTTGVISGREQNLIQMSAPINPGSSGGPLLNSKGEVVGVNASGVVEAQNVGYAIPINDLKIILSDLYAVKLLRKPFLGVLFNNATDTLTSFLNNPAPGGCYVVEVVRGSTLEKAGVQRGDMIYQINGYPIDIFGEMRVPWSEDKCSIIDYINRLTIGETVNLLVYRKGERKEFSITFNHVELPSIRKVYPGYEDIDYEIFAGVVVMELTLNHIQVLIKQAPGLTKFAEMRHISEPALVVTHIFPNSQVYRARTLSVGSTLNEVNGISVHTLKDFRNALKKGLNNQFLTMRASENASRTTDNVLIALDMNKVIKEEVRLSQDYKYPLTASTKDLLSIAGMRQALGDSQPVVA
jgi:serine protease Do